MIDDYTSQALRYLAMAIDNPKELITVHCAEPKLVLGRIKRYAAMIGTTSVTYGDNTLRYN